LPSSDRATEPPGPRRSSVGTVSLLIAIAGAAGSRLALAWSRGLGPGAEWLQIVAAGFEAAVVGSLADWFAVTALFRHPLGLPIPHTAIIPARREKLIETIVSMVEKEWLSPDVIGARLERLAPSALFVEWLADPDHLERLAGPLRHVLRRVAATLGEEEVAELVHRTIHRQLAEVPLDESIARALARLAASDSAGAAFESLALSLANLADRPATADELQWWLERSAEKLREGGKRVVPFFLRRSVVRRKIVEAACAYASSELRSSALDREHPLRVSALATVRRFADRLVAGDPDALAQVERLRGAILESLETGPLVRDTLGRLRDQLDEDLANPDGYLSTLVDRKLRSSLLEVLDDPERRIAIDRWVRTTVNDLLRRYHHQIGLTVRENLEALDTGSLVKQVEDRVGADLQYIRLNGAVVGGLIGLVLAVLRWAVG
jgi:uncharacterized membrane-anchored protein YjiN (DUF445 family)